MKEFFKENWSQLWDYRGRIIGSFIGFVAGLICVFLGFWKAVLFVAIVFGGYFLGKRVDQRGSLRDIFNKVFPPSE